MGDEKREFLTAEQALAMLPEGESIHTFLNAGFTLIGADWDRKDVVDLINSDTKRELAGPMATSMGHGLVVWRGKEPVFVETVEQRGGVRLNGH